MALLQELLKDLHSSMKDRNQVLLMQNILVEIPWTIVDGDLNVQRLIFRKDKSLYIVKDGEIIESNWEYLPTLNSIIVEISGKKILMNQVFVDKKVLILKKDGHLNDFLVFLNENESLALSLENYLSEMLNDQSSNVEEPLEYAKGNESYTLGIVGIVCIFITIIFFIISSQKQSRDFDNDTMIQNKSSDSSSIEEILPTNENEVELNEIRIEIFKELMKDPGFRKKYGIQDSVQKIEVNGALDLSNTIDLRDITEIEFELIKRRGLRKK